MKLYLILHCNLKIKIMKIIKDVRIGDFVYTNNSMHNTVKNGTRYKVTKVEEYYPEYSNEKHKMFSFLNDDGLEIDGYCFNIRSYPDYKICEYKY